MAAMCPQIDTIFHQEREFEKFETQIRFFPLPNTNYILLLLYSKASKKHIKLKVI